MNKQEIATELYRKVRAKQLRNIQSRMPDNKQGVEFTHNGVQYVRTLIASYYKGYDTVGSRPYVLEIVEK